MSVKRCILRFFSIVLFVLGVQNVAFAAIQYCSSVETMDFGSSVDSWTCLANGDPSLIKSQTYETCGVCASGYTRKQTGSVVVYTCYPSACDTGTINASECLQETKPIYTCVESDSGQTSVKLTYECNNNTTITCNNNTTCFAGCSTPGVICSDMCQNEEKELVYWKLYDTTALNTIVRHSANINEYLKNSDGHVFLAPIYKEKIVLDKNGGSGGDDLFYVLNSVGYQDDDGNDITYIVPPSRSGHIFNGYYTEKTGGAQRINADGILNTNNEVFLSISTLYAQWTECGCENGTGATECTATVLNNKCNITWSCNDGYFNPIQSATQSGGYTATCESCIIILGAEFTHSDSGRDSGYDCYRSCKPTDVTLSSAVSGKFYEGATAPSQCVATSCLANTYFSSGTCTSCGNAYPYHDADANGATYCYKK